MFVFLGTYGRKISYNLHHIFQQLYASDKKSVESVIYFLEVTLHMYMCLAWLVKFLSQQKIMIEPLVKFLANKKFVVYSIIAYCTNNFSTEQ